MLNAEHVNRRETANRLARRALFSFIVTFILSRICVFLIMSDEMPNLYFFLHGTHVHHLNYGIFLMSAVCGYSVFRRPTGRAAEITALLYGVAMGLTFDEFGMWLHLGGSYWQRASVDAVIVVAALFGLVAFARTLKHFEKRHFWAFIVLLVVLAGFGVVLYTASTHLGNVVGPGLHDLEAASSP
jgi:ABC-type thiamin/hydroxymethylpyrimidine transport system permease subunit